MRTAITVLLAVVAVALGALVGVLYRETESLQAQLAEQQTVAKTLQAKLDAKATAEIAASVMPASKDEAKPAAASEPAEAPAFDPSQLLQAMLAPKPGDEATADTSDAPAEAGFGPKDALGMAGKLMENEAFSNQIVDMQVDMMYGKFLKEAGLSPEASEAVRAAIGESVGATVKDSMALMSSGDLDGLDAMNKNEDARKAALREALAQNLTPEQLAAFDAYEEELPRRMLEQSYDMQLGMMAGSLDDESRVLVRDALVDQMLALEDEDPSSSDTLSRTTAGMEQALAQLETVLPPDQFEAAQRFIDQQISMIRSFDGMLPGTAAAE